MIRGLHPHTKPQRASYDGGSWEVPDGDGIEDRDVPPRRVAQALLGTLVALLAILAGVAVLFSAIEGKKPIGASQAEARFRTAGPALAPDPRTERIAVEASAFGRLLETRGAGQTAIDRAMREVVDEGWETTGSQPSRAATALDRAEAEQ